MDHVGKPLVAQGRSLRGIITFGASAVPISEALVGAILRHAEFAEGDVAAAREVARGIADIIRLVVVDRYTPERLFAERADLEAIAPKHLEAIPLVNPKIDAEN